MKNFILLSVFILLMFSCDSGTDPQEDDLYNDINLMYDQQHDIGDAYLELLGSGIDSSAAVDSLVAMFEQNEEVEHIHQSETAVLVQYKSGLIGGVFIDDFDMRGPEPPNFSIRKKNDQPQTGGKKKILGMPKSKKTVFLNPSYWERQEMASIIYDSSFAAFDKTGFNQFELFLNEACTIDEYTKLSDYGIVHFYTHGCPYPSKKNIQEVYIKTGEKANRKTTLKYKDYILRNEVIGLYTKKDSAVIYFLNPAFLMKFNDFSENNTLFYGGFCWSGMGTWKQSVVDDMGASVYIGFDHSVYTRWNAWWASKMYGMLGDTTEDAPNTIHYWHNNVHQNYWDKYDNLNVSVEYYGDGTLAFWGDLSVSISPSQLDGTLNASYTFQADLDGDLPNNIKYIWDFDDGSAAVEKVNDNSVTHSFEMEGDFQVYLWVYDDDTNELLGEAQSNVTIREENTGDWAEWHEMNYIRVYLEADIETVGEEGTWFSSVDIENEDLYNPEHFDCPLIWNENQFSVNCEGTYEVYNGSELMETITYEIQISGSFASDKKTIQSMSCSKSIRIDYPDDDYGVAEMREESISIRNIEFDTSIPNYSSFDIWGSETKNYVTSMNVTLTNYYEDDPPKVIKSGQIYWNSDDPEPMLEVKFMKEE